LKIQDKILSDKDAILKVVSCHHWLPLSVMQQTSTFPVKSTLCTHKC